MPGPNSRPNPDYRRDTAQYVPPKLAARIHEFEQQPKAAAGYHKPGSQKK
jgi:hypothetical protein